jgi:hypothetical protein
MVLKKLWKLSMEWNTIFKEEIYRVVYYLCGKVVWREGRFESEKILKIIIFKSNNFNLG